MGNRVTRSAVAALLTQDVDDVVKPAGDRPRASAVPRAERSSELTSLRAAALLKVSRELRQPEPISLEALLERVLEGTTVERDEFRAYLQRNFSLIRQR